MIITLCRHEDGRPVAMIPANGKKENCEVSEARALVSPAAPPKLMADMAGRAFRLPTRKGSEAETDTLAQAEDSFPLPQLA